MSLGLQRCATGPEPFPSLFVIPWGCSTLRVGQKDAADARKPSRSKCASGRGEGGIGEGHDCFFPRGGEEREEKENSFSDSQQLEEEFCVGYSVGAVRKWREEESKRI